MNAVWTDFEVLKGLTLTVVESDSDEIRFTTSEGRHFRMYHAQDCCESVWIESIVGDLNDLVGSPILLAEEAVKRGSDEDVPKKDEGGEYYDSSSTWTFYKLATIKGYVDIRWFGTSNGYYSEGVDFVEIKNDQGE